VPPIVRAERFYLPPPHLPADAWDLVPVAERVLRWYEQRAQRRVPTPAGVLLGQQVYAQINHGRWVADCPCMSAVVVSPADPRLACPECGAGWITVVFPDDVDQVEREVEREAIRERNWWHPDDTDAWNRTPGDVDQAEQPEGDG
jgi:hypothetical protein